MPSTLDYLGESITSLGAAEKPQRGNISDLIAKRSTAPA